MKTKEDIFYKGARKYAQKYGLEQLKLAERLNAEIKKTPGDTAEKIISLSKARTKKRGLKTAAAIGAACACAVLAVVIPFSLNRIGDKDLTASYESAYDNSGETAVTAEEAAPADETVNIPPDQNAQSENEQTDGSSLDAALSYGGAFKSQVIQAKMKLPQNFTLVSVNEDDGKAVLSIENDLGDDVTLIMSEAEESRLYDGLNQYELGGIYAYGAAYPDYSYLTYQKDGIKYDLTSKYELSTLIDLASGIEE